jgi:hypothetical protein
LTHVFDPNQIEPAGALDRSQDFALRVRAFRRLDHRAGDRGIDFIRPHPAEVAAVGAGILGELGRQRAELGAALELLQQPLRGLLDLRDILGGIHRQEDLREMVFLLAARLLGAVQGFVDLLVGDPDGRPQLPLHQESP